MAEENGHADHRGYNNTHRAFLQALLARPSITYTSAKPLLAAIQTTSDPERPTLAEDISLEDFENYIHTLNGHISPFDFEIRSTRHQTSKEVVYAVVNTTSDALTQMATLFTADEIAFVKRVLDAMFEANNTRRAEVMAVTSMQALKLAKPSNEASARRESGTQASSTGLTMAQAQNVMANLVSGGWFELSSRGFYSLSPRALMELRGWLVETYNETEESSNDDDEEETHDKIKFCQACKEIVTVGQRCPKLECKARLHDGCVQNMFRAQGASEQCPLCKTAWVDAPPVGEKAARGGQRRPNGSSAGPASRRSGGLCLDGAADDSDVTAGAEE